MVLRWLYFMSLHGHLWCNKNKILFHYSGWIRIFMFKRYYTQISTYLTFVPQFVTHLHLLMVVHCVENPKISKCWCTTRLPIAQWPRVSVIRFIWEGVAKSLAWLRLFFSGVSPTHNSRPYQPVCWCVILSLKIQTDHSHHANTLSDCEPGDQSL